MELPRSADLIRDGSVAVDGSSCGEFVKERVESNYVTYPKVGN